MPLMEQIGSSRGSGILMLLFALGMVWCVVVMMKNVASHRCNWATTILRLLHPPRKHPRQCFVFCLHAQDTFHFDHSFALLLQQLRNQVDESLCHIKLNWLMQRRESHQILHPSNQLMPCLLLSFLLPRTEKAVKAN